MKLNELEYKGLNLFDEISTVEIALHEQSRTIHVFDIQQVVEPEYNFSNKNYMLSEGFYKMAVVLEGKQFFEKKQQQTLPQWIDSITWHFYSSKKTIKTYKDATIYVTPFEQFSSWTDTELLDNGFYPKYAQRL
ncbi:aminopeptidase [Solibacillus sp. FSL H8-0538]|uniref:aminopeptidase n=1 Tax=Solibacillus sp. FSL H8-0538 TaxID=2921400 RepID=UPI0030F6CC34